MGSTCRFTPTCVGTARRKRRRLRCLPVHPHVRGDGGLRSIPPEPANGSPPRAWGRHPVGLEGCTPGRFTPTCVGTASECQTLNWRQRFTPTCVGTAQISSSLRCGLAVHPHVRGDGKQGHGVPCPVTGSPPRAWGRRQLVAMLRIYPRFTPTCVGTALSSATWCPIEPVHPHVRGDGLTISGYLRTVAGSPPRAWGRRNQLRKGPQLVRFTPTCVGTVW